MQILPSDKSITQNTKLVKVFFDTFSNNYMREGKISEEPQFATYFFQEQIVPHTGRCATSSNERFKEICSRAIFYVPSCQDERYFFCSGVKLSILTPSDANLS